MVCIIFNTENLDGDERELHNSPRLALIGVINLLEQFSSIADDCAFRPQQISNGTIRKAQMGVYDAQRLVDNARTLTKSVVKLESLGSE